MKNRFASSLALTLTLSALSSTVMADTASEVRQVVLDQIAHLNQELNQDPMRLSKDGSKEFNSSGGLLNHLERTSGGNTFEMFEGSIKHIEVVVLVEGQAAVAHFYQEAMMKPTGLPAVPNYRTRVTQIFVKEEGDWKIRAAHWSPLMGGAGTSQTVIK
jgi:hypothetical protein|tara:strand:- start:1218 stop:1694 length:477 start_codon:yes stop_codon:yes gene_type:complete